MTGDEVRGAAGEATGETFTGAGVDSATVVAGGGTRVRPGVDQTAIARTAAAAAPIETAGSTIAGRRQNGSTVAGAGDDCTSAATIAWQRAQVAMCASHRAVDVGIQLRVGPRRQLARVGAGRAGRVDADTRAQQALDGLISIRDARHGLS